MRFTMISIDRMFPQAKGRRRVRQRARRSVLAVLAAGSMVAGCADDRQIGVVGYIEGFSGVVAADEPQAVLAGRDILSAGGRAADAAVAMAFTLAVTLPSAAGLGGGGLCVVYDAKANKAETLDFLPGPASGAMAAHGAPGGALGGGRAVAVPALGRGMFALNAKYGTLRWEGLLAAPENLARFGFPVSRAFGQRLADLPRGPGVDPRLSARFAGVSEGGRYSDVDLAGLIGRLRQRGPGEMHDGQLAREIAQAAQAEGIGLTVEDLRRQLPRWLPTTSAERGNEIVHTATTPGTAGGSGGAAPGATGFVVADSYGNAVSCALTLGRPFGSGRIMPNQGFVLADASAVAGGGEALATLLMINPNVHEFHLAIAGAGAGAAALQSAVARPLLENEGDAQAAIAGAISAVASGARVNVASCPQGIPPKPASCRAATDPRGAGYALRAGS